MNKACFFDLDGTLIPNPSSEVRFLKLLLKKLYFSTSGIVIWFLESLFKFKNFKNSKAYYQGLKAKSIQRIFCASFNEIKDTISQKALQEVERRRNEGYKLFLITGAPDFIAYAIKDYLRFDGFYASFLEIRNGKYTGRIVGKIPFGKNKQVILREIADNEEIDLLNSLTYADHHMDIHFLKSTGQFFAVNPTKKLRENIPKNSILIWD